jgi:hypothetical protein
VRKWARSDVEFLIFSSVKITNKKGEKKSGFNRLEIVTTCRECVCGDSRIDVMESLIIHTCNVGGGDLNLYEKTKIPGASLFTENLVVSDD